MPLHWLMLICTVAVFATLSILRGRLVYMALGYLAISMLVSEIFVWSRLLTPYGLVFGPNQLYIGVWVVVILARSIVRRHEKSPDHRGPSWLRLVLVLYAVSGLPALFGGLFSSRVSLVGYGAPLSSYQLYFLDPVIACWLLTLSLRSATDFDLWASGVCVAVVLICTSELWFPQLPAAFARLPAGAAGSALDRRFQVWGDPNVAAGLFGIGGLWGAGVALMANSKRYALGMAALIAGLYALWESVSRGSALAMLLALAFLLCCRPASPNKRGKDRRFAVILGLLCVSAVVLLGLFLTTAPLSEGRLALWQQRLAGTGPQDAYGLRRHLVLTGLEFAVEHPLAGARLSMSAYLNTWHAGIPHNVFILYLVLAGVPGLSGFAILATVLTLRLLKHPYIRPFASILVFYMLGGLAEPWVFVSPKQLGLLLLGIVSVTVCGYSAAWECEVLWVVTGEHRRRCTLVSAR